MSQSRMQAQAAEEALHEASKPLARYRDDEDLDEEQRNQEREGDPMLAFIKKKKSKAEGEKKIGISAYIFLDFKKICIRLQCFSPLFIRLS